MRYNASTLRDHAAEAIGRTVDLALSASDSLPEEDAKWLRRKLSEILDECKKFVDEQR